MKSIVRFIFLLLIIISAIFCWNAFGPLVSAPVDKYFFIKTNSNYEEVKENLIAEKIISHTFFFDLFSKLTDYPKNIKSGKFEFKNNSNLFSLIRKLKSGRQSEVRLVINKLRTKENLAAKISENFEVDSVEAIRFLLSNDSLAPYGLDTNSVMSIVIPNSYLFWWNSSFNKIFSRLKKQHDYFWEGKRTAQAKKLGFTAEQVYTIASIVEEETNMEDDKPKIASVYINRLKKGMKLEADPTVKYALRQFELKRILHGHLSFPSSYNTYQTFGLPPGPICTPSINTIDAVLNAPATDYIFFVAKPDFSGYSAFSSNYSDHLINAKKYQQSLDILLMNKSSINK